MKKRGLIAVTALAGAGIAVGAVLMAASQNRPSKPAYVAPNCQVYGTARRVAIGDGKVRPEHTDALLCDTLTITNADNRYRLVAFGPHDNHVAYDGVSEKLLSLNQSLTIVLNRTGTYHFHDHLDETAAGTFTVTQPKR